MNNKKCPHGLDVDPLTNQHIFPSKTYDITEHDTGQRYTVIEHNEQTKQQEKTTDELIEEAKKLFRKVTPTPIPKPLTKQEKELELEQSRKEWGRYFREHPDKIPYKFPKTFLDKDEK